MVATASTEHSYWLPLAFVAWNRKRLRLNGNRASLRPFVCYLPRLRSTRRSLQDARYTTAVRLWSRTSVASCSYIVGCRGYNTVFIRPEAVRRNVRCSKKQMVVIWPAAGAAWSTSLYCNCSMVVVINCSTNFHSPLSAPLRSLCSSLLLRLSTCCVLGSR